MEGVADGMIVGSTTEVLAGEGMILTAGAIDAHVHCEYSLQLADRADTGCRHLSAIADRGYRIRYYNSCRRRVSSHASHFGNVLTLQQNRTRCRHFSNDLHAIPD